MERLYTLQEAESELGIPRVTLRRWLESGKIQGTQISKKTRLVWMILESEVLNLKGQKQEKQEGDLYEQLYQQWIEEMVSSFHGNKPLREPTIENYKYGMQNAWK
jgi:hypothetical protein